MRSYLNKDVFFKKMKKKPELMAVIDNIHSYSEQDIDNLSGPHFPLWIKDQLKSLSNRNGRTSQDIAIEIANKMIEASKGSK